ncbi:unnamed protein product [Polarella glacialis]|uniref:Secreted protein n=1 Tax=Polarella glacialis TaxID=89957 RepID=A0A813I7G6_POLGL|nr:unnamed protein product [Polarella glacialis]CAE8647020.1 unnamed protein product [Polarella glacialis]
MLSDVWYLLLLLHGAACAADRMGHVLTVSQWPPPTPFFISKFVRPQRHLLLGAHGCPKPGSWIASVLVFVGQTLRYIIFYPAACPPRCLQAVMFLCACQLVGEFARPGWDVKIACWFLCERESTDPEIGRMLLVA